MNKFISYCSNNNNPHCIEHKVQLGVNINQNRPIKTPVTAGSTTIVLESVCVCVILVEKHTRSNLSDYFQGTALHVAVGMGNLCLLCYLIDREDEVSISIAE